MPPSSPSGPRSLRNLALAGSASVVLVVLAGHWIDRSRRAEAGAPTPITSSRIHTYEEGPHRTREWQGKYVRQTILAHAFRVVGPTTTTVKINVSAVGGGNFGELTVDEADDLVDFAAKAPTRLLAELPATVSHAMAWWNDIPTGGSVRCGLDLKTGIFSLRTGEAYAEIDPKHVVAVLREALADAAALAATPPPIPRAK